MGTNFYVRGNINSDPEYHIGKRSAAGLYCWDCGMTLCKGGLEGVHHGLEFHERCPQCNQAQAKETFQESAAGRELGFNNSSYSRKTGVRGCASFNWDMTEERFITITSPTFEPICLCCGHSYAGEGPIEDEYGNIYTVEEFLNMLEECPIQFKDSVGKGFS